MDYGKLIELWREEEKKAFKGWDFSYLQNRWVEKELPWDYRDILIKYLNPDYKLLDMGTGGGEFLLSLNHPYRNTSVTEMWEPNVKLCKEKLEPLGIEVKQVFDDGELPFESDAFDMIINRHESYDIKEVERLLKPNGIFIIQQVGGENNQILSKALIKDFHPSFPENTLDSKLKEAEKNFIEILYAKEFFPFLRFKDIGALRLFKQKNVELESSKQSRRVTSDTINIYSNISSIIVYTMIFSIGFYFAFKQIMTIGTVIAFIQLGNYVISPVRELAPLISNRRAAMALIDRIAEEVEVQDLTVDTGIHIPEFRNSIVFTDVNFSYGDHDAALDSFSYTFEKGKNYAVVGSSGSGKSTILKLILGYYHEYDGEIAIDGISLKEVNLDSLYNQVSIIQQDVFLFDSSLENNITMFRSFNESKLNSAIERAGLSKLIKEKSRDYACGEGGKNLSGGEKQRISIARSLIRDTAILLMDEATSGLDNETSTNVESAVLNIEGMTRIIVTHRFNEITMKKYDEIVVMNRGKLVEHGTFDKLMKDKGYFYSLYNVTFAE